jgi:hypothetical protein
MLQQIEKLENESQKEELQEPRKGEDYVPNKKRRIKMI